MGRIEDKFSELRGKDEKAFIVYIPFGFPTPEFSREILLALNECNVVDIIELGLPFSDPLADGPILQEATSIAIKKGATTEKMFSLLREIKGECNIPIIVMSYFNPIYQYGIVKFINNLGKAGVAGVMAVDLPVEEVTEEYLVYARKRGVDTIFFITPTTSLERAYRIAEVSKGFIYYISVTGITGPRKITFTSVSSHINKLRKNIRLPICVGFGIHTSKQVKEVARIADGVIVGSAIAQFIMSNHKKAKFIKLLQAFVRRLHG